MISINVTLSGSVRTKEKKWSNVLCNNRNKMTNKKLFSDVPETFLECECEWEFSSEKTFPECDKKDKITINEKTHKSKQKHFWSILLTYVLH